MGRNRPHSRHAASTTFTPSLGSRSNGPGSPAAAWGPEGSASRSALAGGSRREGRPGRGQHLPGGLAEGKGQLGRRSRAPDERGGCAAPCASCGLTDGCTRDSGTAPRDPRTRRSWATNRSVCAGLSSELHAEPEPQSHPQATDHIVRLPTRRRRLKKQNSNGISTDKKKYSA